MEKTDKSSAMTEITEKHLQPLREKARKTGRIEDRMEYARVKQIINELTENVKVTE
ncbi:hypothetical protein [Paenibacillus sp. PL91]|uniref:hypothetical protein n=1 Tax=Paenibacillus sp. PL91 TaxID=2729538 RepID=UPI00145D80AD|nr:hypothetical protein [Paenibacillus sp. PL91]MBC9199766.1 hypothetical protein [Paenibacillus sp. PL91]